MPRGTLVALPASVGQIDTSDYLTMCQGFQKVFIANGANLKVADFINSKIVTSAIGSNIPHHGTVLTGSTSGAVMITDYISSSSGTCTIYGYNITDDASFVDGEVVTGTNNDNQAVSFILEGNEVTGPLWYSWKPYANDSSTYGSLPERAYLVCLYRGRLVLSGNPQYPYQWYMSRQANPWDWAYAANDAQSPVAGGNSDAGEVGDMIRAMVPYRDEYLLFGCTNSLWVLKGDPAEGGTLQEVDLTKGMFGPDSWCYDGAGNLYFASMNGICMLPAGFGPVVELSNLVLPNMFSDFSVQPSTHRICMGYDKQRQGILVTITKLVDGENVCYYYDLKTRGWFPEEYPYSCGVYSMFSYDSPEQDQSGLLLGSTDGYIRVHDDSQKSDADTSSSTAIMSNLTLPVIIPSDGANKVKMLSETVTLGGGASSGTFSDSDGVTMEIYSSDDAETLVENIRDGETALHSTTITGPGKSARIRNRASGNALAIRLVNNELNQSFTIEKVTAEIQETERY